MKKCAAGSADETRQLGQPEKETAIAVDAGGQGRHMSRRVPGLDGVRALAVLAVIAFHVGMRMTPGGFLGVDVFFVLSGYLITDLLVAQHARRGRLDLRGFWVRRAGRLLPALAVLLVAVTAAVAVIEPDQLSALRPALAATVSYSSNWYQALHHVSYFASFGPPPPLQHLWSLAIEEQFYLAWPLLLLLMLTRLRGRRARALTAWLGALASAAAMALTYLPGGDPSRVYYGTDTHATGLLVGAALALTWPMATLTNAPREFARRLDYLGAAGLVVLAWAVVHLCGTDPAVYPLGLAVAALAAAGLTAAAAAPGTVSALLSLPPLRWLGVRSYGIYLWHWPVIAIAAAITGPGPTAPWLWAVEATIAITLAAASWKWLEEPVLRNGFRATCRTACRAVGNSATAARRPRARALPVLWAAAALTITCTAGYGVFHSPAGPSGMEKQIIKGERISAATQAHASGPAHGPAATPSPSPTQRKVVGKQVTAIGDSVMLAGAMALRSVLPGIYIDAKVSRQMPGRPGGGPQPRRQRRAAPRRGGRPWHQLHPHHRRAPPTDAAARTAPQIGAHQHLRARPVEQRRQHHDRGLHPPAPECRARGLVRHDQAPDLPALAGRDPSPIAGDQCLRAHGVPGSPGDTRRAQPFASRAACVARLRHRNTAR